MKLIKEYTVVVLTEETKNSMQRRSESTHIISAVDFLEMVAKFHKNYAAIIHGFSSQEQEPKTFSRITATAHFNDWNGDPTSACFYDTRGAIVILDTEGKIAKGINFGICVFNADGLEQKEMPF